jgi:hypothetical protein
MKIRTFLWLVLTGMMTIAGSACYLRPPPPPPPFPMFGRETLDWREVLGCWRMLRTEWPEPWTFALDSVPAVRRLPSGIGPGDRAARVFRDVGGDIYWSVTPRSTVEFSIEDGLHGTVYEFVLREGRLVGRVDGWTDIVGVYSRPSRVVAERAPCPAADAAPPTRP